MKRSVLSLAAGPLLAIFFCPPAGAEAPQVVTSILPVQSLAANVMRGVGSPGLLVKGAASPHGFQLRPSDAANLQEADLVIWVGEGLETFLEAPLETLSGEARMLELAEADGVNLLPNRHETFWQSQAHADHGDEHQDGEDHAHESHEHGEHDEHDEHGHDEHEDHGHVEHEHEDHEHEDHGHDGHDHDHGAYDPHIWLNPGNAVAIVEAVAAALAEIDPQNAEAYRANARDTADSLERLDAGLRARLEPLSGRRYLVFHDAYQYFEARYGLEPLGAVTLSPELSPGAQHLSELRERMIEEEVVCVFSEPQFEPKLLDVVTEGTGARGATLDPLGADLAPGPAAYFTLMEDLAANLESCLAKP